MGRRFLALTAKEFKQLFRDVPILFILLYSFTVGVYEAGHAMSLELRNYPILVYDMSRSPQSRELVSRLQQPTFKVVRYAHSDAEVTEWLDSGKTSVAVIIPPGFTRDIADGDARFQVIADGTMSLAATVSSAYFAGIAAQYNVDLMSKARPSGARALPQVDARIRVAYNPNLTNSWFSSLLEVLNHVTMVAALLTAAAIVREREYGTLDQLLVTPIRPVELFLAKILPSVVLVVLLSAVALFAIVHGVFATPIRGSLTLYFAVAAIYAFAAASLGIAVASFARNMGQAMMILFLVLFPMMFLSGATTPPESMSPWMAFVSHVSPMRYYIDFGFQVLFKGNGLREVWGDVVGILATGGIFFAVGVNRFRRMIA